MKGGCALLVIVQLIWGCVSIAKTKQEIQREYEKRTGYAAQAKYKKEKTKQVALQLNLNTDSDILQKLDEVPNKQGYIKALIRADIAKEEH